MKHMLIILLFAVFYPVGELMASSWVQRADFGAEGRHRGTGISIANKGYIGLGHYNGTGINIILADWWEYDPANNTWSQKADFIGNSGNGNYAPIAFGIGDFGYIGGGVTGGSTFYQFNPATNSWSQKSNMPTFASDVSGFSIGKMGYFVRNDQLYEYNSDTDQWTTKNQPPFSSTFWNSAFSIDGKGYVKNGLSLWEYKPATDSWIARASFPGQATAGSVAFTHNNKGYIVSGFAFSLSNVNSEVWEFDPQTNTWSQLPNFSGSSRRFAAGFTIGNRSFFGTGTNGTNFNDFWEFDLLADQDELNDIISITCYPNPATEVVMFKSETEENYSVKIFDLSGREIMRSEANNYSCAIDCTIFCAGNYVYLIENEHGLFFSGNLAIQ